MNPVLVSHDELCAISTVVDASALVSGNFHSTSSGGIRVDGRFKGRICLGADSIVFVSSGAILEESELSADVVVVSGYVHGKVTARIAFEATDQAEIHGSVQCLGQIKIHPGSRMDALLSVTPET
jgi:cytoskeletal protein CcmA (bactofilin family)